MKYRVMMQCVVATSIIVEADDPESAIEAAYVEGTPGLMFLNHKYPDEGEWLATTEAIDIPASSIEETVYEVDK